MRVSASGDHYVAKKESSRDPVFGTTWVHVFEEDTTEGHVYRSDDDAIPLSRRPREQLELDPDGSARIYAPGPDDRFVEQPATWKDEEGTLVIKTRKGIALRIVDRSAKRLVVRKAG
jgi:hypothetical protein